MQKERLKIIADLVEKNSILADIGTDHGLIPMYLSTNNISKKIIASDISNRSLQKLIDKLNYNPNIDNIEVRVSNGLDEFKVFEVDSIIIAGMGGLLITDILSRNLNIAKSANNLILQANNGLFELRKFLVLNGFKIIEEMDLFENNIYYQIVKTEVSLDYYENDYEYEYGKLLIKNKSENLKKYLNDLIIINENIIADLKQISSLSIEDRIIEIQNKIKEIILVRNLVEN